MAIPASRTGRAVIIGAGIGGLTAAALLRYAGWKVTVLEAHIYPGGSAGTFFHKGYHFDAGATLAGGFSAGGPHARLGEMLGLRWNVRPVDPAWVVHVGGKAIAQWAERARWRREAESLLPGSAPFWNVQERLAQAAWQVSAGRFAFPPERAGDVRTYTGVLRPDVLSAAPYLAQKMAALPALRSSALLGAFVDAQLMISAQTTAQHASALYGSAALDLPRRGVNAVTGGMGGLGQTLAEWLTSHGGEVRYRQPVVRLERQGVRVTAAITRRNERIEGDVFIANLTPVALLALLGKPAPARLEKKSRRQGGWGAFMLYLGLDAKLLPGDIADHHQVVMDLHAPPGEGNTVFLSLSPEWDSVRAPAGERTATLSTHTDPTVWWRLYHDDPTGYQVRKAEYSERLLRAAEIAIPGIRRAVRLELAGTPRTFAFYTRRPQGLVGGYAQESLFGAIGPGTGIPNLWLVGDSIFPGQSTAGVTLGAWRVAEQVAGPLR